MKLLYQYTAVALALIAVPFFLFRTARTADPRVQVAFAQAKPTDALSDAQKSWLEVLEQCESNGNANAINPKDRDGLPSYGILQFQKPTFEFFQKLYGTTGNLMQPQAQETIVVQMILRGGVDWHKQFPDCTKKLGVPTLSTKALLTLSNA